MKKKISKMLLILGLISMYSMPVLASGNQFTDYEGLIVSVPADLPLTYVEGGSFSGAGSIVVSGGDLVNAEYTVDVSLGSSNIEYTNSEDNTVTAQGVVSFGENGVATFENDDIKQSSEKAISIGVSTMPEKAGDYSSTVTYTIDVERTWIDDIYFTKTVDTSAMTCEITGLTDAGKAWVVSEVTSNTRAVDVSDTSKAAGELKIPNFLIVDGAKYTVKSIGSEAFTGNTDIKSVTMADTVTKLGYRCFQECSNLVSCQLSDNITEWGELTGAGHIFYKCTSLSSVNIPSGVDYIPKSCFNLCTSLKNIDIPANNIKLGNFAFYASGLESIDLPEGTTFAGSVAYADAIGQQFQNCTSLTTVNIPSSVTFIPFRAFQGCTSLKDVTLPNSISEIGFCGFCNCTAMTSFVVPDSCEKIYNCAFEGCSGLTSFSLPVDCSLTDTSGNTGWAPFYNCKNIKNVTYTAGRTGIGIANNFDTSTSNDNRAPFYCGQSNGTVNVVFAEGVKELPAGSYTGSSATSAFGKTIKSVTFPSTLTQIYSKAFIGLTYVSDIYWNANNTYAYYDSFNYIGKFVSKTTLHLGDNITGINRALTATDSNYSSSSTSSSYSYRYINYIDWGNSQVTIIRSGQFKKCDLKELSFPSSVTTLEDYALSFCQGLTSITIPNTIQQIGAYAFYFCDALTDVYWDCPNVTFNTGTTVGNRGWNNMFYQALDYGNATFHFGDSFAGVDSFQKYFFSCYPADTYGQAEFNYIDWGAFNPSSLNYMFYASNIKELEIPSNVTTLNSNELYLCQELTEITIPSSVTLVKELAFYDCSALTTVYYEKSESYRLANMVIEDAATNTTENEYLINATWVYGEEDEPVTFSLRAIEEIEILPEDGIEIIDADLLAGFPDLKVLILPNTIKEIQTNAFLNLTKLETINYNGTESEWLSIIIAEEGNDILSSITINYMVEGEVVEEPVIEEVTELEISSEDGVEVLNADTFAGYSDLKTLILPNTLKSIEANAFLNLTSLETINFNGTESEWSAISIEDEGNEILSAVAINYLVEEEPIVDESVVDEPIVDEPIIDEPIIDEPVVEEPEVEEPVVEEPVVEEPEVEEPEVDEPIVDEPIIDEPVVDEPITDEPVEDENPTTDVPPVETIVNEIKDEDEEVDEPVVEDNTSESEDDVTVSEGDVE